MISAFATAANKIHLLLLIHAPFHCGKLFIYIFMHHLSSWFEVMCTQSLVQGNVHTFLTYWVCTCEHPCTGLFERHSHRPDGDLGYIHSIFSKPEMLQNQNGSATTLDPLWQQDSDE